MSPLLWLIAAIALLAIEIITPGLFYFACLAVGALIAAFCAWMGCSSGICWTVFFVSSALLVVIIAPLAKRYMKHLKTEPVGLDKLLGQKAYVIEAIDPASGKGQVRLESGEIWRAMSEETVASDCWVEILAITGTRLRVKTLPSQQA